MSLIMLNMLNLFDLTLLKAAQLTQLINTQLISAQITSPSEMETPEAASVLFSGPQFFIALVSGILLAFAIQLLLTNFSVAAGISYLGNLTSDSDRGERDDDEGGGLSVRKITTGVGIWTLISVSVALFFACYLAVQLSLLTTPRLGAIISLVIWAAYFTLLMWVSSTTVGSFMGSVVQTAISGFQAVAGTATAAIGGQAAKRQVVSTAEAVAAAVKNELGSGLDPESLRESMEDYVGRLKRPGLDTATIRADLKNLLNDPEIAALAREGQLSQLDRQAFVDLLKQRTDLSKQDVNRLADVMESVWAESVSHHAKGQSNSMSELVEYLRSTQSGQLKVDELNAKVDRLLAESSQTASNQGSPSAAQMGTVQTVQSGLNTLVGLLAGRTDLSDISLSQIMERIQSASSQVVDTTQQLIGQPSRQLSSTGSYSPIQRDVEDYLRHTYSWQMGGDTLDRDFCDLLYDPQADPATIIEAVSGLKRSWFVEILSERGVFTQTRIQEIADQLEGVRQAVLRTAEADYEREVAIDLRQRIEIYLTLTPKEQLLTSPDLPAFRALIADENADHEMLTQRLAAYNRAYLEEFLQTRSDLTISEQAAILDALEQTRNHVLFESQSAGEQAKQRYEAFQHQITDYLRNTSKSELNPEGIKRDLQLFARDPATGFSALRHRAAQFDRDTIVQLLSQREDLSPTEANQIVDHVESNWYSLVNAPRTIPSTAVAVVKDQADQTLITLKDYLRQTNLEELDPDGIQRDLKRLFDDPKAGASALRQRLSHVDRNTLVKLLSQRPDLTEAQVNRTIDQVLMSVQQLIRAPRRAALRTQQKALGFEQELENYLRNTNKDELNPEGIKRDLRLLLNSPKHGAQSLTERLSRVDRSTLVALLSQRQDMTPEEAERVVVNLESSRDQILAQVQQVQARVQSVIDGVLARIRNYFNSLDRPELNYDSIKQDVRTLFDDPQAGFEALRGRLSQFDRGTLIALLSSRDDISEADANRIIDQVEGVRNSVLQRAERVQLEAQRRLEAVKLKTQRQLEETRKAAATAAWWLFTTAIVSAGAAVLGGILASSRVAA
jgi:nucleoid DNA-binding protein